MSPVKIFLSLFSGIAAIAAIYLVFSSNHQDSQPQHISKVEATVSETVKTSSVSVPEIDRIREFFNLASPKFPIVETVTYSSRASWQKGKSAWLSDYATHYKTSRHFIARSLNQKSDYLKQNVREGDRFNVLKLDANFSFYLVLDISNLKLLFYYIDLDTNEPHLIKTYVVSAGRVDSDSVSGFLTPLGKYSLGDRIAVYDSKKVGFHQGEKTEMVKIFGTRWIPFEKEIEDCTASAKGYGIHGMPWLEDPFTQELREDASSIGCHSSDGCIRLKTEDIEELFSIIISRPTTIEIVKDYHLASIQGGF